VYGPLLFIVIQLKEFIMKHIVCYGLLLLFAAAALSCHSGSVPRHSALDRETHSSRDRQAYPTLNREIKDAKGNIELLGRCTKERLQQPPFDSWFVRNYEDYPVDSLSADQLRSGLQGKRLMIFMGTWCGDSRREVPRMFKILDYCGIPDSSVELIMVSEDDSTYKQSPQHEEKDLYIFRVPDLLIVGKDGELGRIVESPVISLEKDLLAILDGNAYAPHYPAGPFLANLFRTSSIPEIRKDLPAIAGQIRPLVKWNWELRSFAHVLAAAGEKDKADVLLEISASIFPK
jgi:hypothetical protein